MSKQTSHPDLAFDRMLLSDEYLADPYPIYHELRASDPVHFSASMNGWVLTRYADVVNALHDPRLISGRRIESYTEKLSPDVQRQVQPLYHHMAKWIGNLDPPDHTRLRALVNKAFTPRIVANLRPRIGQIVDQLLDAVEPEGRMDGIADFAYPLPAIVIAEMLGVVPQDRWLFMKWSDDLTAYMGTGQARPQEACAASNSAGEMVEYFRWIVSKRRTQPREDLISSLVAVEEQGQQLLEHELLSMCGFLIVAGHETTMALLGNGLLALLRNADQRRLLADNPALLPTAVEELLRYDSPIQHQTRVAAEPFKIDGKRVESGQRVVPFLGAANRDPAEFPDPDRLDLRRRPNRHVAFGHGIHYCLGAPLARLEGQIAFGAILRRLPTLKLEIDTPKWRRNTSNRNPISLPVVF